MDDASAGLVRPLGEDQFDAVLALNNRHAAELSLLTRDGLAALAGQAFLAATIGKGEAFLIALDEHADYGSPNYLWFKERYERFVYVDRIAVDPAARGKGHARALYEALFARAREAGFPCVVCEVNEEPPNPASDAFHAALGFAVVGEAVLPGGAKRVRYFERILS